MAISGTKKNGSVMLVLSLTVLNAVALTLAMSVLKESFFSSIIQNALITSQTVSSQLKFRLNDSLLTKMESITAENATSINTLTTTNGDARTAH